MLDLLSPRKSAWLPHEEKLGAEKAKGRKYAGRRKLLHDSRPHSYHGNQSNLKNVLETSRKLEKRDNVKFAGPLLKNKLLASLNCAQADVLSTFHRVNNVDPMVEFGYGGGFTDVSQTWKFHPFKTR
jgi:hypothetical protein